MRGSSDDGSDIDLARVNKEQIFLHFIAKDNMK